ncbi:hypothetical protein [Microbacterium salsuginis]|uniref:hypothetical protein n=1 Tax=Microbacterium salsuginis TaxID=2722803 RepID=UPI001F0EC4BA|nr:hypothetical protein [Microbacterium sp. CFH 90308]
MPPWAGESLGLAAAVAISIGVVAVVAASARSELMFRDGDSLVTTLVIRSLATGQPQDWAMSTVLFLPEAATLGLLTLLGLGVNGTLALAGVVNLVAFYGALRVAAGSAARARAPIAGALLALAAFGLLAISDTSPSRDALELASLLTLTTYYSATTIGVVLAVGIARRALDRRQRGFGSGGSSRENSPADAAAIDPRTEELLSSGGSSRGNSPADAAAIDPRTEELLSSGGSSRGNSPADAAATDPRAGVSDGPGAWLWGSVAGLGVVAAASVLTNPLFAAWGTVPLGLVLAVAWALRRRGPTLWLAGALIAGTAVGFVGRMPLAPLIANTGAGYADPSRWADSLGYYGALLTERWSVPWGAASVIVLLALWSWCLAATVVLARRGDVGATVVAACGWVIPLLVVAGAIVLGTNAARYLQPAAFAPLLGLLVLPGLSAVRAGAAASPLTSPRRALMAGIAGAGAVVLIVLAGAVGVPRIAAAASAPDADLECVVDWVEQSGRTGGGQFWTVRLPKAHLADPRSLVQVDHQLRGYAWLVNRDDFTVGEVSFLVLDDQSPAFDLPGGASVEDARHVSCGRYTIADFGDAGLPLGPQRS